MEPVSKSCPTLIYCTLAVGVGRVEVEGELVVCSLENNPTTKLFKAPLNHLLFNVCQRGAHEETRNSLMVVGSV